MGERGNCKFFAPNYFNATKCQNCFKPKEQHSVLEAPDGGKSNLGKAGSVHGGRNVTISKTLLKESVLLKAQLPREKTKPESWERHWFALYSNGELQEYAIVDGQINKENMTSSVMLQDFIRMLDGSVELGEDLCFGIKTLRETLYFKTAAKVDYENWWKEISSFVASPLKRTASASVSKAGGYSRPTLCKQLSMPLSSISPTRSSRSSSISSLQSDPDHPQIEILRTQVAKLEEENSKLLKTEEHRRKLELEVNYWKEYLTSAQLIKKSGGSTNTVTELADARRQVIQLQDELNQTQKRLNTNSGKLLMRNKEVNDGKEKLREANSIIAVYKAKIDQLTKELMRNEESDFLLSNLAMKPDEDDYPERVKTEVERIDSSDMFHNDAQHLEDKFMLLKDRLKRIERELMIKSKELEKANESRSKVAKYTRSLLQELETRLSDNAHKLAETEEKLKTANIELGMERERRIKLEENPRRRLSSMISPLRSDNNHSPSMDGTFNSASELTEHDANTKYADYYRSRFKEAESSLLEKDKKLHQAEEKMKEIQSSMKHNSANYKILNDLQTKLSDATHKLSDRQLKIHELTCEVGRLKEFEKTYRKKTQQCGTLEDIVNDLESRNLQLTKSLHQAKRELEMFKIREVVLKEQLQTFADDSEESDSDDDTLVKSVDLKMKIESMIDLESLCKKLTIDNEKLKEKNIEFENRLRHLNMQNFKTLESNKEVSSEVTNDQKDKRIKELEQNLSKEEDQFCSQLMTIKEQYLNDISTLEKNHAKKLNLSKTELEKCKLEIDGLIASKSEADAKIEELNQKLSCLEVQLKDYQTLPLPKPQIDENNEVAALEIDTVSAEFLDKVVAGEDIMLKNASGSDLEKVTARLKLSDKDVEFGETKDKIEDISIEKDCVDSVSKDRDSGIVITQEIKSMIEAAKNNNIEIMSDDTICWKLENDSFSIPHDSVSEIDIIENYKMVCSKFQVKMREMSLKYVSSEEKVIELSQALEKKESEEHSFSSEYDTLLARIDELELQIIESQEMLQSKADELEKERKNVIHLVEVTSAYIKELEGSLAECKSKLNERQSSNTADISVLKSGSKKTETIPEEVEGDLTDNEEAKAIRQKLTAKIMTLESDISELIETHNEEMKVLREEGEKEIASLEKQLAANGMGEDPEKMLLQVESLENELKEQNQSYAKEVELLNQHYQEELKRAFSGDNASIDMLSRMQELEMENEQIRKECDAKLKEMELGHEQEKQQIKDDMATVLQATLSASLSGGFNDSYEPTNSTVEELEERVIKLEQEQLELEQRYKDDLEMEKKAHQTEMEDTIRDMMMVRNASRRYSEDDPKSDPEEQHEDSINTVTSDEIDALNITHTKEIENLKIEHEQEVAQIREDFTFVISSLKQGSSSDTIIDLQGKIKDLEQFIESMKNETKKEVNDYEIKIKRLESANFFAVRRNEEMGGKIYNMQIELEELDRQHQMEIAAYHEKCGSADGNESRYVNEYIKQNNELKETNKTLENELEQLGAKNEAKLDALVIKLNEEKREELEEMTDKVLKLESLIDEMKENHIEELKAFEKYDREEKLEANSLEKERIKELECACAKLRSENEDEIAELAKEHKKEVEKLRVFYEKEIGDMKKRIANESDTPNRKISPDPVIHLKQTIKEMKDKHEKEIIDLSSKFSLEKEGLEIQNERAIEDMRMQYDEKLKMGYKEGLRRQSVSERKSDITRLKQVISEKEAICKKLNDVEIKYEKDMKEKKKIISCLQKELKTLKTSNSRKTEGENITSVFESDKSADVQKKVKDIREQIERYERRIEYYKDKSAREGTEESHRVLELQQEILELHKELNSLTEVKRKTSKQDIASLNQLSRKSDGSKVPRRHTDNVTVKLGRRREHDTRKRWSNLEETSEKEETKTGSVLARKTLWENISVDT